MPCSQFQPRSFDIMTTACRLRSIAVVGLLLLTAGCAGDSPVSPSGDSGAGGAVISGTITSSAASPTGVTVRVMGTNLTTTTGDSGRFEITSVPTGRVELRFTAAAVDATAAISNVAANQFIEIQVQLGPASAVIVSEEREGKVTLCHTEGNGTYHSISVSESAEATHRAHGDGKIGDPVPGQPLKVFDEQCRPAGPSIEIEKQTNGEDADSAPGPRITVGDAVVWEYRIVNTGTLPLTAVTVVDDKGVAVTCGATTLAAGASMTCTGAGVATLGQYTNLGTVTAAYSSATSSGTVTSSDRSHYLGVAPSDVEDGQKVTLCHRTGSGKFVQISVSVNAEPAHRAHGDGKVGEAVPNAAGKTFGAGCSVP